MHIYVTGCAKTSLIAQSQWAGEKLTAEPDHSMLPDSV